MFKQEPNVDERQVPVANDAEILPATTVERVTVRPKGSSLSPGASSSSSDVPREHCHGDVELVGEGEHAEERPIQTTAAELEARKGGRFAFLKRPQFWIVLCISQVLAIDQTGTNTLTTLLQSRTGWSLPAFQSMPNYILLMLVYGAITIYKYGFKGWLNMIKKDGWRYIILAFFDVEGNYLTVYAYQYTTILSAQLINFWAIAVVVLISLTLLKVRYHIAQYLGILVACGGLGILVASDHITGSNGGQAANAVKGDLFALAGATCYGISNVLEEFLVSKRPMYEVIGQLGFFGIIINGITAAIFDRKHFREAQWSPAVGGYLTGYTLLLSLFYTLAPIVFRMASAAFFNIGLLTGNFWSVIIGTKVFGDHVHYLYPIAFVLIIGGHFVYYGTEGVLGEAKKPWLGENQEGGDDGLGTARRQLENPNVVI